jgi:hypothetical protein
MSPKKTTLKAILKRQPKNPSWTCICGEVIAKKSANLSGGPQYDYGYHVHCPKCNRTVAQFIDPKEVM